MQGRPNGKNKRARLDGLQGPEGLCWQPTYLLLQACQLTFQPLMSLQLVLYPTQVLGHVIREACSFLLG